MTKEMIITELQNRGYNAESQNSLKNGVVFEGIRIFTDSIIAPVIYTSEIIRHAEEENKNIDEVVNAIINIYESNKTVDFNLDDLFNKEFILNHLFIGLQKESTEQLVKRDCELDGIESYLYIRREKSEGESYSVKLSVPLMERVGIVESDAWMYAESNTYAETTIQSMAKIMSEMMGMEYTEEMDEMTPFYVITNKSKVKGASAILDKKSLLEFAEKYDTKKLVVLPSSVHEMLILPYTEDVSLDEFSEMVGEVNSSEVEPSEQLGNKAFIITL